MDTIKLEKGIIHLMLPFRLESGKSPETAFEDSIWTKTDEDISRLDFLLEHVREFFSKNYQTGKTDESACIVSKLKIESAPVKMFNNRICWLSNRSFSQPQKSEKLNKLAVYLDPGAFRIIYHPITRVAILLYSVELVSHSKDSEPPTLADFIRMNYLLRLFNRHDEAFFISQNERPEERKKSLLLLKGKTPSLFNRDSEAKIEEEGWRPDQLINYLLYDLNKSSRVVFFDNYHFVPVCFLQPAEEIKDEDLLYKSLFFIRKVYDFDYTPSPSLLRSDEELLHPYKQIYYAASLEGVVVLNNCSISDPEFLRTFYSNSFKKSLWLAILGLLQRSVFLQLMKEVSNVDPDDHKRIKEYLRRYTTISLKAIFSKVSIYHQHNDFYDLIIHQFQVNELQTELKDELYGLNNLQRQFHEDEVERHDEMEKLFEKKFNLILFALSIFSLIQVTYAIMGNASMSLLKHSLAIGIPLVLGIIFWQMMIFRKN